MTGRARIFWLPAAYFLRLPGTLPVPVAFPQGSFRLQMRGSDGFPPSSPDAHPIPLSVPSSQG